ISVQDNTISTYILWT
nr:immunoglobulin heavy chain junction region [Mus musculus]